MTQEYFANDASCTLGAGYTAGNSTITVSGASYGTGPGKFPIVTGTDFFRIKLGNGDLYMKVTTPNTSTNVWNVSVIEGATDTNVSSGLPVKAIITKGGLESFTTGGSGAMTKIGETLLTGSAASVTFSSIPGTYRHLVLEYLAQASAAGFIQLTFNGDTTANYDYELQLGTAAVNTAVESFGTAYTYGGMLEQNTGLFAAGRIDLPHYTNTVAQKSGLVLTTRKDGTSSGNVFILHAGIYWRTSSAAITSITLTPSAGVLNTDSLFTLYGVS